MSIRATILLFAATLTLSALSSSPAFNDAEERHRVKWGRSYPSTEERQQMNAKKKKQTEEKNARNKSAPSENNADSKQEREKPSERSVE